MRKSILIGLQTNIETIWKIMMIDKTNGSFLEKMTNVLAILFEKCQICGNFPDGQSSWRDYRQGKQKCGVGMSECAPNWINLGLFKMCCILGQFIKLGTNSDIHGDKTKQGCQNQVKVGQILVVSKWCQRLSYLLVGEFWLAVSILNI